VTLLSEEKKAALRAIRDERLLNHGPWIHSLIRMIIEHPYPRHLAEAIILFNRVWGRQLPFISQDSLEGSFIKRSFIQFIESESPLETLTTMISADRRQALEYATTQGYVSNNPWFNRIILILLSHSKPLSVLKGINFVNQLFLGQLLTIDPKSHAGVFIHKIFAKFLEEKYTPDEILQYLADPDKMMSLNALRANHLFAEGEWTNILVTLILRHPNSREFASALILLNRTLFGRLSPAHIQAPQGLFLRALVINLTQKTHPFIHAGAFSLLFRLFRYRYTFAIATEGTLVRPFHLYFSRAENGFLNCSFISKDGTVHSQQALSIMAPEPLTLEALEAMKEKILSELDGLGLTDYYDEEWFNFFKKSFLNHPTPYTFALMLSKFNDLNFWENCDHIRFIECINVYSPMWLLHPEFLYLFMQLPQESLTPELLSFIIENSRAINIADPTASILEQLNGICLRFKQVLDCQIQGLPLNPYINLLFQKEEFIKAFPEAQTELFDPTSYSPDNFESSTLKTKP
jgi:hypothetical protein